MYEKIYNSYVFLMHREKGYQIMFQSRLIRQSFPSKAEAKEHLDKLLRGDISPEWAE